MPSYPMFSSASCKAKVDFRCTAQSAVHTAILVISTMKAFDGPIAQADDGV